MQSRASPLAPLRQRAFLLLWTSSVLWNFARWIDILVAGWLALELTNSPWLVALIGFYRYAPLPVFGALAGAVIDRFDRRRLVIAAECANILATVVVAGLLLTGSLEYWHLAAANLLLGLAWSVEWPARRAIIPDAAGRDQILPAIVLDSVSMNVTKAVGPILGGGLIAVLSASGCYALLIVIYSLAILPLLRLKTPPAPKRSSASTLRFVGEGLIFCRSCQPILGVLLVTILMNCFVFPYNQLLSVFARDVLLVGPLALGFLAAGDGVGSLIGSAVLVTAPRLRRPGWLFIGGSLTMCVCLFAFAASPLYGPALAFLVLGGFFHSAFSTFQSTIILGSVDDRLRGRALGILTLAIGSTPIGMLQMGGIAGNFGAPNAVLVSTLVGAALVALVGVAIPGLRGYAPPGAEPPPRLAAPDRAC